MPHIHKNPIQFQISDNTVKPFSIADIESIRVVEQGLQINFLRKKLKASDAFDISHADFIALVAGAKDELGEFHFSGINDLIYPRINLLRETDNTKYASLCPLCGNTSKIYHNGCNCSITKPFDGEVKKTEYGVSHAITKQLVVIEHKEMIEALELKSNRFGLNEQIREVTHLHKEKGIKGVFGYVKIRDQSVLVHSDEVENNVNPTRYYWTAVEASQMKLDPELYKKFIGLIKADNSIYMDEERVLINVIDGCKNFPDVLEFEMWSSNDTFVYNSKQFELEYDESDDTWGFISLCSKLRVKNWFRFE